MSEDNAFWLILLAIVGATMIGLACAIGYNVRENNKAAFALGYQRQQKAGSNESMWVKSEVTK